MFRKMMHRMMVFMSKRMIACDEASFLISYRCDKHLGFKRWMQLQLHLLSCHLCRKYASQIEQLNTAVDHYREECSSESCHHNLPEDCRAEMEHVVIRELKAK
jgi:hypothetical protein